MFFSDLKVAQTAAYFLSRRGGQMAYMKLLKLLYLADRESMDRFNSTISEDTHVSMQNGPVLSRTLNLMTGQIESPQWRSWISPDARYEVSLSRPVHDFEELDELSQADIEILEHIWRKHGHLNRWQLVDYTHDHLAEWIDPRGSSIPINPIATFSALGRPPEQAEMSARELQERKFLGRAIADLT